MKNSKESCSCKNCIGRCKAAPGWFKPGEIEKAADYLRMSVKDFFAKYVSVDWWFADEDKNFENHVFVLSPAITKKEAGKVFPYHDRFGECVFFKNGKCQIHAVKPFECKEVYHGTTETEGAELHLGVAKEWNKKQKQIVDLLEEKPQIPDEGFIPLKSDDGLLPWLG